MRLIQAIATLLAVFLSWPVVAVVIALLFKKQLRQLLSDLKTLKIFGTEAGFGNALGKAENTTRAAIDSLPEDQGEIIPETVKGIDAEAALNPSGAVITAWERLVTALVDLRRATAGPGRPTKDVGKLLNSLVADQTVNQLFRSSVLELRDIRNRVAHGESQPNAGEAVAYANTASELEAAASAVKKVRGRPN